MTARIALIGDSQAVGVAEPLMVALRELGAVVALRETQTGISTRGLADRVRGRGAEALDAAIVLVGGNDSAGRTLPAAIGALRVLLPRRVLWIGPMQSDDPEVADRHDAIAAVQQRVMPGLGVRWVPGASLSYDLEHGHDGVHFTRDAYATLAQRIALEYRNAFGQGSSFALGAGVAAIGLGAVAFGLWWWAR